MRKEIVIGAVAVCAIGAAGYFGLISPQNAATTDLRAQVTSLEAANAATAAQLPELKNQLSTISGNVENLRQMSAKVPPQIDLPGLYRELATVAASAGVVGGAQDVTVSQPQLVTTQAAAPATATDTEAAATQQDATAEQPATAATDTAASRTSPIASFDVSMSVKGTVGQTIAFLQALKDAPRLSVVSSTSLTVDDQGVATMAIRAKYFLQQVDVDGLVSQIEALASAAGSASGPAGTSESPTDPASALPVDPAGTGQTTAP